MQEHRISTTTHTAPLHWCHDPKPHSGLVLYMEGPALNHPYRRPHSDNQDTIKNAASDSLHHSCTVSDYFFIC